MNEGSKSLQRKHHSKVLLVLTSIFGLLYTYTIIDEQYGMGGNEPLWVKLLFVVFLVGYLIVWKHEGIGGLVFVLWWIGMWYIGLFVAHGDRGAGVVIGLPLLVLAILFIISWYKRRPRTETSFTR